MATKINNDGIELGEQATTPATPAAGRVAFYAKTDSKIYRLGDDGIEHVLGELDYDAAVITYTPDDTANWTGATDPGDVDEALDELALRVQTLEDAPPPSDDFTPATSGHWDATAPTTQASALNKLATRTANAYVRLRSEFGIEYLADGNTPVDFSDADWLTDYSKGFAFDFGTNPNDITIPYTGMYMYHLKAQIVPDAPIAIGVTIDLAVDTPNGGIISFDTTTSIAQASDNYEFEMTGMYYHASTSDIVLLNVFNSEAATDVTIYFWLTIARVAGND